MTETGRAVHDVPMFNVYAPECNTLGVCRTHFPLRATVIATTSWPTFVPLATLTGCSVAVIPSGHEAMLLARLETFHGARPDVPLVVVLPRGVVRRVLTWAVPPDELVVLENASWALWPAVECAGTRHLLRRAARALERTARLSPLLRRALALACRAEPPAGSVTELGERAGCHHRTLWRHWGALRRRTAAPALDAVLDWILLLRATVQRAHVPSWSAAASRVGATRGTLARIALEHARLPLHDVRPAAQEELRRGFLRQIAVPLLGRREARAL